MKNYLFVMSKPPYRGLLLQETLDVMLTTAAFDQRVSVLFVDDGVMQLKTLQTPDVLGLQDTASMLKALELYDIEPIYVESESLKARGLRQEDLLLPVTQISRQSVGDLLQRQDVILSD